MAGERDCSLFPSLPITHAPPASCCATKMVFTKSTIRHHRKSLIEAFKEFYRGLCLLENFCKVSTAHAPGKANAQRNLRTKPNHMVPALT
jgi:hypothetical protein